MVKKTPDQKDQMDRLSLAMKLTVKKKFRVAESIRLRDHPMYKNLEGYLHLVGIPFNVSKRICPEFHDQIIDAELTSERRVDVE